ncbi:LTA synthase family protein [Flavobacterium sp. TMP13]|uniref:LTA synthase family protein n=1 Tax=unclassified Flavobacterium TaxID=196869 RepID=UPI00076C95CC|nr:alkaline phosphatase family protein [Flavobacterium sp. TAB 87]KVV16094.1 Lipoteichoic acid synthase 1 [Flavobacterium sp. TAB 87]
MNNYKNNSIILLQRLLLVIIIYQITRFLFYIFNTSSFTTFDFQTVKGGLIFDLAAIGYLNLIFIVAHLVPGNFKYSVNYQKGLKISFYALNLLFIATNFIDIIYYRFTGRRSTFSMITAKGMEREAFGLIPSFLKEFWYVGVLFLVFSYLFWKLLPNFRALKTIEPLTKTIITRQLSFLILVVAFGLIVARGGFRKKPIKIVDAVVYAEIGTSGLVLNTPFCILKTITKKEDIEKCNFFNEKELVSIYDPLILLNSKENTVKKNVVVIILESFGDENVGRGYTPFLDSLITKSYYFKNGYANGRVSIDAVPSILSSIPSLMNSSFISSSYALNKVNGLPKILKNEGYYTSFFHGAFNGSQNFDQYAKVAGFDAYYGKDEYTGPKAFDGKWGIYDEEFMQYFCQKLTEFKTPFFSSIFTISSHNPYKIPEKYNGKFPKGTTTIQESIGYTDYALRQFFKTAQTQKWYKNTLFVLSSDHTSAEGDQPVDQTSVGKFSIPILFFDPSNPEFVGVNERNFQQIDIMPSIVDYLNIKTKMISFGKSFRSNKNYAVYYLNNTYHYIEGDYYMAFDGSKPVGLYNIKKDKLLQKNILSSEHKIRTQMDRFIKAYIQSFNNRIIGNELAAKI